MLNHHFKMTSLMGGQADGTEDMFAKLESMREVITEVNSQFKDPVSTSFTIVDMRLQLDITPRTPFFHRKRQLSSVSVSPSSCLCTRPSASSKSLPRTRLTPTISLSTNCYSRNQVRIFHRSALSSDLLITRELQHPTASIAMCATRCRRNI